MTYIKINEALYPATVNGTVKDRAWDNRESKTITLEMTHAEAAALFVDGLAWFIVMDAEEGREEYDNSEYSKAGSITDNRDGTVSVKMGKLTQIEYLEAQLANAVTEEELETAYVEGVNSL